MGLDVLIASNGKHSLVSEVQSGLHIDLDNINDSLTKILQENKKNPFAGVLGSDDSTVVLAAKVAQQLKLPHNPPDAARFTQRKDLARNHLLQAGCAIPQHRLIDFDKPLEPQIDNMRWPCVIKPLNMSASRGVIRANNREEFIDACQRIKLIIAESNEPFIKSHVLAEEYIDGFEVAYEGYLHAGNLTTLVIFDKPEPLQGPYFEETIYVTPSQLDSRIQKTIKQNIAQACKAYGLTTGPIHAELRIDKKDAWLLEIACRTIGGDCARTLDDGNAFNLEALTIALSTGQPLIPKPPTDARGVMMIPIKKAGLLRRVEGISAARKITNIEKVDIIIQQGNELIPLPEGSQYLGYIFARAEKPTEATHALKEAYKQLKFIVAPVIKLNKNPHP